MKKKCSLLLLLALFAGVSLAEDLRGTYEFPPSGGSEGHTTIIQLTEDDEGNYSALVTILDETIEGTNVKVSDDEFSFDTEVKTQIGDMSQAWRVKVADSVATLSMLGDVGGQSDSMTLRGQLVKDIVGTYKFPPPEGISGDTTTIQLTKDQEGIYSAQVTVGEEMIEATNVIAKEDEFSFDSEVKTQIGDMTQAWKVQVAEGEVTLSILSDIGGQSQSMTLKGDLVNEDSD